MPRDARELGSAWTRFQRHEFPSPAPDLAEYVARYAVVSWDYDEPYRQVMVPYPNVSLTFIDGVAMIVGVSSGHMVRTLTGRGGMFAVSFRPGAFRPFLRADVSTITDRRVPAATVFGADLPERYDVAGVDDFLRRHLPEPDPKARQAIETVAMIESRPSITRVDELADESGTSVRQLQRLFAGHVGVGPKWVIRRYRLREVTERLAAGTAIDWAALAHELGYADQAHFTRDFRMIFGESPTWYAERY